MLLADDDRHYTAVNDASVKLLRFSRDQLLKMRIDDVTPPEGLATIDETWSAFLTTGTLMGSFDVLTGDGRRLSVTFNATANVMPGQHLSIFLVGSASRADRAIHGKLPTAVKSSKKTNGTTPRLRPRELEILSLLALGLTGQQIATDLGISRETVRVHIRNAMQTLGAQTRVQAIGLAMRDGHIALD
ncbi:MAG: LuxR C-terminal-related transcriptional regulator [Solirubrobacterales bacterium]|nr:LuxR C-terminal-related transcriptional regulator [Solirubrobacterales bacterium]